jgi:hypothetical protein
VGNDAFVDTEFVGAYEQIQNAINDLQAMNANAPTRSRELSLAITELQTGLLWLTQAKVSDAS